MHEISLCQSMRRIIETQLQDSEKQVVAVHLNLGVLSCVDPRALEFGFAAVMKHSVAENAVLIIHRLEATAKCLACQHIVKIAQRFSACPDCESQALELISGDELTLTNLEIK